MIRARKVDLADVKPGVKSTELWAPAAFATYLVQSGDIELAYRFMLVYAPIYAFCRTALKIIEVWSARPEPTGPQGGGPGTLESGREPT